MTVPTSLSGGPNPFHAADGALMVARIARALGPQNDPQRALKEAERVGDTALVKALERGITCTRALAASGATPGGFLVPPEFSRDVIERLQPESIVRRLGARTAPMSSTTQQIPKITSVPNATYLGENQTLTKTEQTFGQVMLSRKRLACFVPLSGTLARSSDAEAIVAADLPRNMAAVENQFFIRGDGTAYSPKGLRHWAPAANVIAATAGQTVAAVVGDVGKVVLALRNANVPFTSPAWLMAPRTENFLKSLRGSNDNFLFLEQMNNGRFWGYPYAVSTQIPITLGAGTGSELILVDLADALIGEGGLFIDVSTAAAYKDTGGALVAGFSADQIVVRAILEHDLAMRRSEAVAVLDGITWA